MFDWNDPDQVGHTIWGELSENEDHIVPYTKGTEDNTLLNFGDYNKKQKSEEANTVLRSTEHTAGVKNDFTGCNLENHSTFETNEELSAPRLDMDSWPDLPSLSAALGKGYNDENGRDSIATELMNDFNETSDLNEVRVQLDCEAEMFGNNHGDKDSDSFLDCDWANIGDFDDLDRIFSNNDSIFGHEMISNAEEYLCPSSDVISGTAHSIPMPDMPLSREETSDHGSSCGNRKSEEKTADNTVKTEEQAECKTHLTSDCCGTRNQYPDKNDGQKKLLKSRKKAEERNKIKTKQNLSSAWSHNVSQSHQSPSPNMHTLVKTPLQTFQSPAATQQRQVGGAENMRHLGPSNQFLLSGYGYFPYHFPVFPLLPHTHAERDQVKPVAVNCKIFPDSSKHSNSLAKPPDISSRPLTMTPQEKIEKLRRRQQMQAMRAIQQQQQQFGHQITGNDSLVLQTGSPKKQCQESVTSSAVVDDSGNKMSASDLSMLLDQDESQRISTSIDDHSLEETIYHELQDALGKLDITVRRCIRDSLFRLAQSATERQSAGDRSSTNKSNKDEDEVPANQETNRQNRCKKLPDAETNTNPVDRTVAHLLFYKPSESCMGPVKDEVPQSPVSCTPASKMPLHAHGSTSEENPENNGEMEVQPSV